VAALQSLFGTTEVDLRLSQHQRVFYQQLSRLLIATETLLADTLSESIAEIFVLQECEELVHDWGLTS
jgi:hypothetical protein